MQSAIIRLVVLVILLINQTLITLGWSPLPFSEEQIYEGVSTIATVAVSVYVWWKNNSITEEAIQADEYLKELKAIKKEDEK